LRQAVGATTQPITRQPPPITTTTNPDDVTEKSASVNAKLLRRRQTCEELRRVGELLTKLQVGCGVVGSVVSCCFGRIIASAVG
jgi:hypothetical protein